MVPPWAGAGAPAAAEHSCAKALRHAARHLPVGGRAIGRRRCQRLWRDATAEVDEAVLVLVTGSPGAVDSE